MWAVPSLQAWLQLVQMEREEAEKERQKEEEERKRRKEEANRRKRILEAAFDGDNDEILAVLEEVSFIHHTNHVEPVWSECQQNMLLLFCT